ncbi:hypothetical protein [Aureibaculum conchae]|uniref:hypothetical protein n=1 Tax=Aureibaculum sp. 2308TA14-22 TaxID=3108392 RepID=UPI0033936963
MNLKSNCYQAIFIALISFFFISCKKEKEHVSDEPIIMHNVTIPKGFELEILYHPNNHEQGSWVSITKDDEGRLYTSDQFGHLYHVTLPNAKNKLDSASVKKLDMNIGQAQGLLWHNEALYAMVNANIERDLKIYSGFYKMTDSNDDSEFDKVDTLMIFKGSFGEHGPHNIELSPDKKSMYLVVGNHVEIPKDMNSLVPRVWGEDNLLPIIKDPSGHANDIKAPGGWVAKVDIDTEKWTLHSVGTRNTYDIAFNDDGELFGFDSDMEYDIGMPWYRPIRLCHFTSGAEFGWRTGTGKFMAEYPDNLPGIANLGQGSPTGLLSSKGLKFPEKYKNGLFLFDWSYGTMYFANLKPKGSSYEAEVTEFLSGVPLPLTNGIVGDDGALYFLTGGRRLESALYKLSYVGNTSTNEIEFVQNTEGKREREFRQKLEALHAKKDADQLDFILENLDHSDRFTRFAARVALENQDYNLWKDKIKEDNTSLKTIVLALSTARFGDDIDRLNALNKVLTIDWSALTDANKIDFVRTLQLILNRQKKPISEGIKKRIKTILLPSYLASSKIINEELGKTLSFLQASDIIESTLERMENDTVTSDLKSIYLSEDISKRSEQYGVDVENMLANMPNAQNISYANSLSVIRSGWNDELRFRYFKWFNIARKKSGGRSYVKFIKAIQDNAIKNAPKELASYYESLANQDIKATKDWMEGVEQPKGPGQNWTVAAVKSAYSKNSSKANFKNGEGLYRAALCINCHTMKGIGGDTGPDLTQISTRFSLTDLAEAIVNPSSTISDRYQYHEYLLNNGNTVTGRVVAEPDDAIEISTSAFSPSITTTIKKSNIKAEKESAISPMPLGLINRFNEQELNDFIAYLLSGGDENHEIYKK